MQAASIQPHCWSRRAAVPCRSVAQRGCWGRRSSSSSSSRALRVQPRLPCWVGALPDRPEQPSRGDEAAPPSTPSAEDAASGVDASAAAAAQPPAVAAAAAQSAAAEPAEPPEPAAVAATEAAAGGSDAEPPLRINLQAAPGGRVFVVMAAALTAAGLVLGLNAVPLAASCLKLGPSAALHTQAAALVGCCGASLLRAASLSMFLAEGFTVGEGHTWRYQRIVLGLAAAAAAAALLQPLSWAAAQPAVLAAAALGGGAVAAACGAAFVAQLRGPGVMFASAVGYADSWEAAARAAVTYFIRDVTALSGLLLLLLGGAGAVCGAAALFGAPPASGLPWATGAAGAAAGGEAALAYLRRLLGLGGLLTALQCVALAECAASTARLINRGVAVKLLVVAQQESRDLAKGRLYAPLHVSPRRFDLLHVGFFAAAVMQGLWLAEAGGVAGAGVLPGVLNVNDPLWAGLYWAVLGSGAYLVGRLACIDYLTLWQWLLNGLNVAAGAVSLVGVTLFVDWAWISEVRRR